MHFTTAYIVMSTLAFILDQEGKIGRFFISDGFNVIVIAF